MEKTGGRRWAAIPVLVASFLVVGPWTAAGQVKAWEDKIVIPTYEIGPPEPDPVFYFGRAYQGAQGPVYPYPLLDKLTDVKHDKTYRILYLENEFVRIGVLPEIGGRIFEAVDKTNGYDFVYRQHVIKPALIGMCGAWISGGVEWNIPHHHRATTFMPVDGARQPYEEGGATIWVGEIELRHRMKWLVGLTLRPGSNVLEVTTKIFNRTPLAHSMLAFANVAVHANENYQVFFPPSTEIATFHGKNQFSRWPVSTEVFNGQDYRRGVDVSWWKSHVTPTSFFAFDAEEDFFGGYDHGRKAGIVFVGDHNVVPGKKFWTWGTGSEGKTWERILTDADGPYLELMVGSWSDNQPDYSWIKPGETRAFTQYWYPIRGLGGLKNANRDAACNLEVAAGQAKVAFCSTLKRKKATCELRSAGKVLFADTFGIGPGSPYTKTISIDPGVGPETLSLVLFDADGHEIIRYAPKPRKNPPLPKPVVPPAAPQDIATVEELYLAGQRLEQFHNPTLEPCPYYEEALRRDPSDIRVNTALGLLDLKRGLYRDAEDRLRTAVARLTANYTRPKDGEALYYLGVAERRLGKTAEAEDALQRAAWDPGWQAASFYELAEMAAASGDLDRALDLSWRAVGARDPSPRAMDLIAALYRHQGCYDDAASAAAAARHRDPLDVRAWYELYLIERKRTGWQSEPAKELWSQVAIFLGVPNNALELSLDYANCGLWADAGSSLAPALVEKDAVRNYLLAYAYDRNGISAKAGTLLESASGLSPALAFPYALELVDVFEWAIRKNPADARAPYYLGNLLFDLQPERAINCWEKARALDPGFALVHRNLGLAYGRVRNDLSAAVASLEKAVSLNPKDARACYELDQFDEAAGADPQARLARLEKNGAAVAGNDNALAREVGLLVLVGRASKALEILRSHHFHVWEGGGEIHGLWVEANLAEGRKRLDGGDFRGAYETFMNALSYPVNLDVGPPSSGPGSPKIYFFIGQAQSALGQKDEAVSAYQKAAAFPAGLNEQAYYAASALSRLGRTVEARARFEELVRGSREALSAAPAVDFFEKFGERQSARTRLADLHFLAGLGLLGLGREKDAQAEFEQVKAANPGHLEVRSFLKK